MYLHYLAFVCRQIWSQLLSNQNKYNKVFTSWSKINQRISTASRDLINTARIKSMLGRRMMISNSFVEGLRVGIYPCMICVMKIKLPITQSLIYLRFSNHRKQ